MRVRKPLSRGKRLKKRLCDPYFVKETVQIVSADSTRRAAVRALPLTVLSRGKALEAIGFFADAALSHVNLIALGLLPGKRCPKAARSRNCSGCADGLLGRVKHGIDRQEPESRRLYAALFVPQCFAEHLVPAANTEYRAAGRRKVPDTRVKALCL